MKKKLTQASRQSLHTSHQANQGAGGAQASPVASWQAEHMERQTRLTLAIDQAIMPEHCAELLDQWDNLLRQYWVDHRPVIIITAN